MRERLSVYSMSQQHKTQVIDTLVTTSLWGIDTHGIELFSTYLKELSGGRSVASPNIQVTSKLPTALRIDAGNALGVVAANEATHRVIEAAKKYGIAAGSVSNSNHFGAAGPYAALAAQQGMIGVVMTNSDPLARMLTR